jgi:predicted acetylornithine/succinylornithine family transaminase
MTIKEHNTEKYIEMGSKNLMNTYKYLPLVIEKGEGCYLFDSDGNKYLDFVAGIAVNSLGYGNYDLINNLKNQMEKLFHCSNLYYNQPQIELAKLITDNSCFDRVFFCNSGAEAVESALKLAKKYGKMFHGDSCFEIISMKQSFHGRTMGAISATGQSKYQKNFKPLLPGIKYAEFNNIESVKELITKDTCAIIVEPVQGEGGIHPAKHEFLQELRNICTQNNIVLIFDEVQCGIGRTGKLFAHETYNIKPDIIAVAKGLGGGFPIGAMFAVDKIASAFVPGDHASTFGGNPLACTAGKTVINYLLEQHNLMDISNKGEYLRTRLLELKNNFFVIKDVRGIGLMQGIELTIPASSIISESMKRGLLLIGAGEKVIRFVPPLIVSKKEIDKAIEILTAIFEEIKDEG